MSPAAGESAAWAALLPAGTVWLPRRRRDAVRRLRQAMAGQAAGASLAVAASPWALRRTADPGEPGAPRIYVAIPSRRRPVLVASQDPAVLRYVADSVLSVPPGTGPVLSLILTAALRLLRFRPAWMLAAAVRAGGVVLVGRTR
jgi:hypothetical protein